MDIILTLLTVWIIRFVFVKEGTNVVVTRFGKYVKTLTPGMQSFFSLWGLFGTIHSFKITDPVSQKIITSTEIDMRETVYDYPKERVISKDNVQFEAEAFGYRTVAEVLSEHPDITYYLKLHAGNTISKNLGNGQATKIFLPNSSDQLINAFSAISEAVNWKTEHEGKE